MDVLDRVCQRWSCQAGRKEEDHIEDVKKDMQRVGETEEDAGNRVRWSKMISCVYP